jgi:hypothetical protein
MKKRLPIITSIFLVIIILIIAKREHCTSKILSKVQRTFVVTGEIDNNYCLNASDTIVYERLKYRWVKINCNADFAPRDGAGAFVYKDSKWLIGGWNPPDKINFPLICNNEVWNCKNGRNCNLVKKILLSIIHSTHRMTGKVDIQQVMLFSKIKCG